MSPRARFHFFGGLLVLLALAVLLWAHLARRHAEAALADLTARRAALITQARRVASVKAPEPLKSALASPPARPTPGSNTRPGPMGVLMRDAKLQMAYFAARRANLPATYGPLFRSLNLSAEQAGALQDRILERDEQFFDIVSTVPDAIHGMSYGGTNPFLRNPFLITANSEDGQPLQGNSADAEAAAALLQQNDASFQNSATALLGPAGYQQLLQYERMLPVRDVVDNLGANAAASGAPLSSAQADELTQILANASSNYAKGGVARGENSVDWGQAMPQAAQLLSPAQLAAFQAQVAPRQAMRQLQNAVIEAGGMGDTAKVVHAITGRSN